MDLLLHATVKGVTESEDYPDMVMVTVYVDEFDATTSFPVEPEAAKKWPYGKVFVFKGQGLPRAK